MVVLSAAALMAQAKAVANPQQHQAPQLTPRNRQVNPPAAGTKNAALGKMSYFRGLAEPTPLGKRPIKPLPKSAVKPKEETVPDDPSTYQDFVLKAGEYGNPWNFSIMKFAPANKDKKVDIGSFARPVKMNRKTPKSQLYADAEFDPAKPMEWIPALGTDGQPIYHNGQMVMKDKATGVYKASWEKTRAEAAKSKGKGKEKAAETPVKKKGPTKPKTRQVFKASDETRARRKEEFHPWVLEDSNPDPAQKQEWVGTMTNQNENSLYALLTIQDGAFQFIPVHRFYKFIPKHMHSSTMRADDVEKIMSSNNRSDAAAFYAKHRGGHISDATKKTLARVAKMEAQELKPMLKNEADDDDGGRMKNEMEGDMDEMEWEDDVQDDDEGDRHEEMAEDDDEKQMKERLKREYIAANKASQDLEEEDDEEFEDLLNADGKRLKNVLKKTGDLEDDSDDSDDDYYGERYGGKKEEEEEEDSTLPMATGVQQQSNLKAKATPPPGSQTAPVPSKPVATPVKAASSVPASTNDFRASPTAGPSGSALLAKRATSSPKRTNVSLSRANPPSGRAMSPLAGEGARAASPPAPKSIAPANAATINAKKRKEAPTGQSTISEVAPAAKKTKPSAPAPSGSVPVPTAQDLINFLNEHGGKVTTKAVAKKFGTKDSPQVKAALVELVKQVGTMKSIENVQYIILKSSQ